MGFFAAQWAFRLTGLPIAQLCIVQRIAWSCRDETAFLDRSTEWLANQCSLSIRSLERHLPQLAKLGLLTRSESGFRLPKFLEDVQRDTGKKTVADFQLFRQIGGESPGAADPLRQNGGQIGGAYKEGFFGKERRDENKKSSSPQSPSPPENSPPENLPRETPIAESEIERLAAAVKKRFDLAPDLSRNVVLLGLLRGQGRQRIRSPEYFRAIVDELRVQALPATYGQYLERKLEELRGLAAARSP